MSDANHPNQVNYDRLTKTKIVCTLGPASDNREKLNEMIKAGMDTVRFNLSHGSHEYHQKLYDTVQTLNNEFEQQISTLFDIQGPKIRTGVMEAPFHLSVGDKIKVAPSKTQDKNFKGNKDFITISYDAMLKDLDKDDVIYINDGIVKLVVEEKQDGDKGFLLCRTEAPGEISDKKGCNIPKGNLSIEIPTKKDKEDLKFIAGLNPDYLAASFIENAEQVKCIRKFLEDNGNKEIKIISKIERPQAIDNIDEIIEASDGIMVARGDLGVEVNLEDVPVHQKSIVQKCNHVGKTVIVATQMLESMTENSRPTRAETNDVFNAVLDGADAVMLSGETAAGKFPVQSIEFMDKIIAKAEKYLTHEDNYFDNKSNQVNQSVGSSVRHTVEKFVTSGFTGKIVVITTDGMLVKMISKFRPQWDILAFTENERVGRELNMVWATRSICLKRDSENKGIQGRDLEEKAIFTVKYAVKSGWLKEKDHVIVVAESVNQKVNLGVWTGSFCVREVLEPVS